MRSNKITNLKDSWNRRRKIRIKKIEDCIAYDMPPKRQLLFIYYTRCNTWFKLFKNQVTEEVTNKEIHFIWKVIIAKQLKLHLWTARTHTHTHTIFRTCMGSTTFMFNHSSEKWEQNHHNFLCFMRLRL